MGDDISDEEKVAIATKFMLASPPGEFNEVVTDVRALVDDDALLNKNALQIFRTYNCDQMIAVELPGSDTKCLITEHGEIDVKHYFDPHTGQSFSFDHVKQEVSDVESADRPGNESLRAAIDDVMQGYVGEYFPDGVTSVYSVDDKIVICLSAQKFNASNFWNGRWRSVWTLQDTTLTGEVKANVHYYEDGNVQLESNKSFSLSVSESEPAQLATEVLKNITTSEKETQEELNENYRTMGETTFKGLRRKLPITHTKLDFYKMAQHKVVGEMSSK